MKKLLFIILLLLMMIPSLTMSSYASYNRQVIEQDFLGDMDKSLFIAMCLWGYIGMVVNLLSDVSKRNPKSKKSPKEFSFTYWLKDNWHRTLLSIIMVPISIITFTEMFGMEISIFRAMGVGFISDYLIDILKRRTNIIKKS